MASRWKISSNHALIENLVYRGYAKNPKVIDAMLEVDRGRYCPYDAYNNTPIPIDCGQTISAPDVHAMALELLAPFLPDGGMALDVGCGSGIMTAYLAHLAKDCTVYGIDIYPELIAFAKRNLSIDQPTLVRNNKIIVEEGDGWDPCPPLREDMQFNVIHVGAAAEEVPDELLCLLAPGGRLVMPVGGRSIFGGQTLLSIDRDANGDLHRKEHAAVVFVPLQKRPKKRRSNRRAARGKEEEEEGVGATEASDPPQSSSEPLTKRERQKKVRRAVVGEDTEREEVVVNQPSIHSRKPPVKDTRLDEFIKLGSSEQPASFPSSEGAMETEEPKEIPEMPGKMEISRGEKEIPRRERTERKRASSRERERMTEMPQERRTPSEIKGKEEAAVEVEGGGFKAKLPILEGGKMEEDIEMQEGEEWMKPSPTRAIRKRFAGEVEEEGMEEEGQMGTVFELAPEVEI